MIAVRLLAPVLVDFRCVAGASLRDPQRYAEFWARCDQESREVLAARSPIPSAVSMTFTHTRPTSSLNLYQTIDGDASGRPFHLLEGELTPAQLPEAFPDGGVPGCLAVEVLQVSFRLYDHGIALVEVIIDVSGALEGDAYIPHTLDRLQETAVTLGERASAALVARYLDPLLTRVRNWDRDDEFVVPATPFSDPAYQDFGHPMWVTRSLFVPSESDSVRDTALRHWLKDVVAVDDAVTPAEDMISGDADHSIRWLNYAFVGDDEDAVFLPETGPHCARWEGLRYAQVFYAALDRIDSLLSQVLADSATADSGGQVQYLKQELLDLSQRAELVIMERQRLSKYLSRPIRRVMDDILRFWDHEELVELPVRFKIQTCDRRLAELAARRNARSALFTDLILLGIGVTSILGTALAVSEFGRSASNSVDQSAYDLGRSSLIEWFAGQPADAILVTSGMISVLVVALYLFFRRHDG